MATFNVSNSRKLDSALDSARSGDRIVLDQGEYDALEINGSNKAITITSANDSRPAVFDELDLRNVSNLTLDGLKFDDDGGASGKAFYVYNSSNVTIRDASFEGVVKNGYGANFGLHVQKSEDITVERSDFSDFTKAASFIDVEDLNVLNNDFYRSSVDAMVFGDVHDVRIEGNEVHGMKTHGGLKHKDLIQFWATPERGPSDNVLIKNNVLKSGGDSETHGIYIGNEVVGTSASWSATPFQRTSSRSDFYENFVIEDNTIITGQYHGLTVGATDGVTIRNNEVLQEPSAPNTTLRTPRIVVVDEAVDVKITGNTAHFISDDGGKSWNNVPGNKIVPLDYTPSKRSQGGDDDRDGDDGNGSNGEAELFPFNGRYVKGTSRAKLNDIDFDEGDEILFVHYNRGTFKDSWKNSNRVDNNKEGTYVKIDSLADLQEISAASDDVSVSVKGDTLVMTIDQNAGTHQISLEGIGNSYDALF